MRSKRLLAMLLALCLMFSCTAPAALAVEAPADSAIHAEKSENAPAASEKNSNSPISNDLLVSVDENQAHGVNTMRDSLISKVEEAGTSEGDWVVTPAEDPDVDLLVSKTPDCLEELKKAAEVYQASDTVAAFVVMEEAPLADSHKSRSLVSASVEKAMIEKQDSVISAIEKTVLNGEKLTVRYQFTYLTNSFTIETNFANLEKIAKIRGVKSVFIMPVYSPTAASPNTYASGAMTGVHTVWEDLGYTGEGMKIAIIDTGLDLDHPSFGALDSQLIADNSSYLSEDEVAAVVEDLNAYKFRSSVTAEDLYRSTKVPYAFNYCDANLTADHSADAQGDHGTHVAGIAAANGVDGTNVIGMAPDAQIIVMKVFGASKQGAHTDDIVAALEDAMTLGCDVVNASLGSPAGFSSTDTEIDLIYERLAYQNIIATISAGNEGVSSYGNMWGTDLNRTQNPDNATVGSPSTYANAFSIASAENSEVMTDYFALADGTKVFYQDSIEAVYGSAGYEGYESAVSFKTLADQELEYVIVPGLGSAEDVASVDVNGKIAVIMRGSLSFSEKVLNAQAAGAVGVVIWNSNDTDDIFSFGMTTAAEDGSFPYIPSCIITLSDGQLMNDAETKNMTVSAVQAARVCEGGQMSSFSSWGVSPDLKLVPDITGIGGNVYSCYDGGTYGLMSGTSMSAPQVAGVSALVMQYLYTKYPNAANDGSISDLARAILMSTADPIISSDSDVEASPRQQGAGLVDAAAAVNTKAYLTVNGDRPKAELGDSKSGTFTFTFEIHNISNEAETFTLSSSLLTEDIVDYGIGEYFMAGQDVALSGDVTFSADTVTVAGGETAEVTVTITLSDEDKVMFARYWENGGYVEGFVYLDNANEEGVDLSLPFLGFYGDWTQAPVFDSAYWYDNSFWGAEPVGYWPEGDQYYHVMWTSLAGMDYVLGFNPYTDPYLDMNGKLVYDPANNSVSPNGDGVVDGINEIYLSLLRNAKELTFTYTVDGEIVHVDTVTNAMKTMYFSSYGQIVPWLDSWYDTTPFDFSTLENDDKVILTIEANVDYGLGGNNVIEIPITVDTEVPELLDAYQITEADGSHSLVIITSDNVNVAAMYLMNPTGTRIYDADYALDAREDGTYMATFNVDELGTELMVALCDYAGNEGYYNITFTAAGDNLPDMTPYADELFAYRVFDNYIYSDHMYGWVSMNKPAEGENANLSIWTDDYLEYAAINAAEYVDGKIFAVDAVYNLVVMDPGVWNRKTITNLGVNVLDMTFDDSTDTMYVLSKQDDYVTLYSMDLLTGELTRLKYYGYYTRSPWAIADDDNGTLYAIMVDSSSVYTLDTANSYAMAAVTDANGDEIIFTDSYGDALAPSEYGQSITYANGNLYWAYYHYNWMGGYSELVTINTTDWTSHSSPYAAQAYDADGNLVTYSPSTELVGLLSLTETDYEIPASDEAISISLDAEEIIIGLPSYHQLTVSWLPWNYDLDESQLVWTSDDESVATVDASGKVTAVGEGITYVTVTYGDLSATCKVIVVKITGTFNAYNYYSADGNYGYMTTVDMETMDYVLLTNTISPVDFMAGDYNGHDGYFYGYDMGGQLYRYDIETNEATALGASMGTYPVDMAYDYSTGMMYMMTLDYTSYENKLYAVNMNNGKLLELATGMGLMTLACATDGTLYAMDAYGTLCQMVINDYTDYGMGMYFEPVAYVLEEPFGELYLLQSMCWDHNNNVLLWNWCEAATMVWIDVENGYYINLGDHTESGVLELTGMHVIPDEIPELPDTAVESVTAEDLLILTGYEKVPAVTVAPFTATCQDLVLTVADPAIVEVTETGTLKGLKAGVTEVTATLDDTVGGQEYEATFTVTVMDGADNVYAHLLTDVATYNAQAWIELNPGNPGTYDVLNYFDYTIFTAEHHDGKIYTYGYDANDWEANWQYFIMDTENHAVETQIDMGEGFPYVYDMTFDYVTSTMYVLAGASEDNTDLYVADLETGKLSLLMETEPLFMALAAGPEGKLYVIENSKETYDEWDPWAAPVLSNANLWVIDPLNGTSALVGDTGLKNNMITSMAYDYDTDALYWTAFASDGSYISHLAIVDTETGLATSLGAIGSAGAQVGGLHILCDEYPEADTSTLHNLLLDRSKTVITGETAELSLTMMPGGLDADIVWTSSDETVAAVDENGVVTGVSQGVATVTVEVTYNGVTKTASCKVAVLDSDAGFLTWNVTDMGWALINRNDYTVVKNLTTGEELGVQVIASVGNDVYGYDDNNQLFKLDTATFQRTTIGDAIVSEADTQFTVKDMAYDAVNERMLLLADVLVWDEYWEEYSGETGTCSLFTVDLTTGELEELYNFADAKYIYGMSVGSEGQIYFYSPFDDGVDVLDLTTGTISRIITLQTQSIYGDHLYDYSLHFDEMTDILYLLFTSNGRYYKMLTINTTTGSLVDNGAIGELVREDWYDYGDSFAGMTFVEMPEPVREVKWVSANTNLSSGNINLNFFAVLSDSIINDPTAEVRFTVAGKTIVVPMSEATVSVKNGVTRYRFPCELYAKMMSDDVTAQVYVNDEAVGASKTFSIKAYCEAMIARLEGVESEAKQLTLLKSMLNYGAAAQNLFSYNTDNLANESLSEEDKALAAVDASAYAFSIVGSEDGIKAKGANLIVESDTTARVSFLLTGDKTIDQYTFTIDGVEVEPIASSTAGKYYIDLSGIGARGLDEMHEFSVGGLTVNFGVLSYVHMVLSSTTSSAELVNLVTALYHYNAAAEAYFG